MEPFESFEIGSRAPDFELKSSIGENWKLSDQEGSVVALLFYPGDETLVCTKQLCSVRDNWQDYLETKAKIVGISPGTPDEHAGFAANHSLPLTLLADEGRAVTARFGFHWILPIWMTRAIVIVDAKGIIRSRRAMFRGFRPTDRSVITSIYEARSDALEEKYGSLKKN